MSDLASCLNGVKRERTRRGWTQAEVARRAGLSRAAVSAIEIDRLVPSVAAALRLAACFETSVEALFGRPAGAAPPMEWALPPRPGDGRFWRAEVAGRVLDYPCEETAAGEVPHDGLFSAGRAHHFPDADPNRTLVVACCDPAAGLLAGEYARQTGLRMIALKRPSAAALALLGEQRIHAAGVHLSAAHGRRGNESIVRREIGPPVGLLRLARWEEGVALAPGHGAASLQSLVRGQTHWIGRQPGSGAQQCLESLLGPGKTPHQIAEDHRGVAGAVRLGWAEAGVCVRLVSEEAGLRFFSVRIENYDLVFHKSLEADPRIEALIRVVRSESYRRLLGELPGYDSRQTGELAWTAVRRPPKR